jgi:hypothetical protein
MPLSDEVECAARVVRTPIGRNRITDASASAKRLRRKITAIKEGRRASYEEVAVESR